MKSKTHKSYTATFLLTYLIIIALGVAASIFFTSCSSVKKIQTSSSYSLDSATSEHSTDTKVLDIDSTGKTTEKNQYLRETVIEEFAGGNGEMQEFAVDSAEMEKNISQPAIKIVSAPQLIKRTTIKETGTAEKQQEVKVKTKDTVGQKTVKKAELKKEGEADGKEVDKKSFPWGTIIFWGIVGVIAVGIFIFVKKKFF